MIDTRAAEAREQYLAPIFEPIAQEVVDRAKVSLGENVVDVGCGTGPLTRIAARRLSASSRIAGLDIDPVRVALARKLAEQEKLEIEWFEGSALEMPFEDGSFDVALSGLALQFLPDRKAGLEEIRRVLRPQGRLVASVWRSIEYCPGHHAFARAMAEASGNPPAPMPPFSLGNADELRMLADDAGLVNVQVQPVRLISVFTSVEGFVEAIAAGANTTRKALEAFDEDTRASIGASVANALERYLDDDELRLPMEANILTATV